MECSGDGRLGATALLNTASPPNVLGYGLTYGVFCREAVALTDPAAVRAAARAALPDFPQPVLELDPQLSQPFDDCRIWDVGRAADTARAPARTDLPALLLAGSFDHITPPGWADVAAQTLPNARVVRIPGAGHVVLGWSDCARSIMASFLDTPQRYDTHCLDGLTAAPFDVRPGR